MVMIAIMSRQQAARRCAAANCITLTSIRRVRDL